MAKYKAKRENGNTPNGNPINFRWVVRDENGKFVEVEKYRNDLADKYGNDLEFEGI